MVSSEPNQQISSRNGKYKKILAAINILTKDCDISIDEIKGNKNLKDSYDYLSKLERNSENILLLDKVLQRQYKPLSIEYNTIGSFLYGCMKNNYGINKYNSPFCVNSLHSDSNDSIDYNLHQIWRQNNKYGKKRFNRIDSVGHLKPDFPFVKGSPSTKLHRSPSFSHDFSRKSHKNIVNAKFFVIDSFKGFTHDEISEMVNSDNGVQYVEIYKTIGSKHYIIHKRCVIKNLPKCGHGFSYMSDESERKRSKKNKETKDNSLLGLIAFAIVIIIIFIVIYWIGSGKTSGNYFSSWNNGSQINVSSN